MTVGTGGIKIPSGSGMPGDPITGDLAAVSTDWSSRAGPRRRAPLDRPSPARWSGWPCGSSSLIDRTSRRTHSSHTCRTTRNSSRSDKDTHVKKSGNVWALLHLSRARLTADDLGRKRDQKPAPAERPHDRVALRSFTCETLPLRISDLRDRRSSSGRRDSESGLRRRAASTEK
jgi:hypothetical protein